MSAALQGNFPALTMAAVKQAGLFSGRKRIGFRAENIDFIVWHDADDDSVIITWKTEKRNTQRIRLEWVDLKFGARPYFICPISDERCLTLFYDRAFASAESLGLERGSHRAGRIGRLRSVANAAEARLLGADGERPATGEARRRYVRRLRATGLTEFAPSTIVQLIAAVEDEERAAFRRNHRHRSKQSHLSTERALASGSTSSNALPSSSVVALLDPGIAAARAAFFEAHPCTRAVDLISRFPALDIRALEKRWTLDRNGRWGTTLIWSDAAEHQWVEAKILVTFDVLEPTPAMLIETRSSEDSMHHQLIVLERSHPASPLRWYMRCPVTGARREILYYRAGRFASAKAQRLVHPSQRVPR